MNQTSSVPIRGGRGESAQPSLRNPSASTLEARMVKVSRFSTEAGPDGFQEAEAGRLRGQTHLKWSE